MAEAMGVSTFTLQSHHLLDCSSLCFIVARWLLAHFQRAVNPSAFGLEMGIEYLFMAVIGGLGYVSAPLWVQVCIKLLDDYSQVALPGLIGTSGSYEVIVFGIAMVFVLGTCPMAFGLWSLAKMYLAAPLRARWIGQMQSP